VTRVVDLCQAAQQARADGFAVDLEKAKARIKEIDPKPADQAGPSKP
jgi:hypothetical protein